MAEPCLDRDVTGGDDARDESGGYDRSTNGGRAHARRDARKPSRTPAACETTAAATVTL